MTTTTAAGAHNFLSMHFFPSTRKHTSGGRNRCHKKSQKSKRSLPFFGRSKFPCPVWERRRRRQIVLSGNDESSCLGATHVLWERHIVLLESDTSSYVGTTIVFIGSDESSSLGTTRRPVWKRRIVSCGNNTLSCVETAICQFHG